MQFVSPRGYLSHKESLVAHVFRNPPARPPLEAEEIMTSCEVFPAKGVQAVKSEGCTYELHQFNLSFLLSLSQGIKRATYEKYSFASIFVLPPNYPGGKQLSYWAVNTFCLECGQPPLYDVLLKGVPTYVLYTAVHVCTISRSQGSHMNVHKARPSVRTLDPFLSHPNTSRRKDGAHMPKAPFRTRMNGHTMQTLKKPPCPSFS